MDIHPLGLLLVLACFALAFVVSRRVAAVFRKRRLEREQVQAASQQSRQVRRAQARQHKP